MTWFRVIAQKSNSVGWMLLRLLHLYGHPAVQQRNHGHSESVGRDGMLSWPLYIRAAFLRRPKSVEKEQEGDKVGKEEKEAEKKKEERSRTEISWLRQKERYAAGAF